MQEKAYNAKDSREGLTRRMSPPFTVVAMSGARYRIFLTVVDSEGNQKTFKGQTTTKDGLAMFECKVGSVIDSIPGHPEPTL